jgi:allantoinase
MQGAGMHDSRGRPSPCPPASHRTSSLRGSTDAGPPVTVVRGRRVVTPTGVRAAAVHAADGRITAVTAYDDVPPGAAIEEAGTAAVLPGFVDVHVHVNEPGRTDWEGFATATAAAAAGGVTTIIDMPLNSVPVTTTVAALDAKRAAAEGACAVDVGFWAGLVPDNVDDVPALWDAGVFGFKAFLADSGIDEFPVLDDAAVGKGLAAVAELGGLALIHAEDARVLAGVPPPSTSARRHRSWLASRPAVAEEVAVARLAELSGQLGVRVHVVHVSADEALAPLTAARRAGAPMTAETCPHYLTFTAEDIPDGATQFKCAPPIRPAANRPRLWAALAEGAIDVVASDHSPSPPDGKALDSGDFSAAWGGISSLQIAPSALWTGARRRGHTLVDLVAWASTRPAELLGLPTKGRLEPGCDADIVVFDDDARFVVAGAALEHRHPLTPYEGRTLRGVVRRTWLRGELVFDGTSVRPGRGRLLRRAAA